jgi:hypothetical protein
MSQRILLVFQLLVGVGLVALALVWPQGQGAVSPAPFNRPLAAVERTVTIGGAPVARLRGGQTAPDAPAQPQE